MDEIKNRETSKGPIILTIGKILFGTTPLAVRLIPLHALVLLLPLHLGTLAAFAIKAKQELKTAFRQNTGAIILFSLSFLIQDLTYYMAVKIMPVSIATLIRWTAPIFVVLASPVIGEKITKKGMVAALAAFLGLLLILLNQGLIFNTANLSGILFAVISAFAVAIYWLSAKTVLQKISAYSVLTIRSAISLIIIIPIIAIGFQKEFLALFDFLPQLIAFGLIYGILAAYLDTLGIQKTHIHQAAVLGYLVPLTAIVSSFFILQEKLDLITVGGGILILIGGFFIRIPEKQNAPLPFQTGERHDDRKDQ